MSNIQKPSRAHQSGFNSAVAIIRRIASMQPSLTIKELLYMFDNSDVVKQLMEQANEK